MTYLNKWIVNFKILMMFITIWMPLGILSVSLWLFAYLHEQVTILLNKFGQYLVMYKMKNDPPNLMKLVEKMVR